MQDQDLCSEPWKSAASPGLRCHPAIPSLVLDLDRTPCKFPLQHRSCGKHTTKPHVHLAVRPPLGLYRSSRTLYLQAPPRFCQQCCAGRWLELQEPLEQLFPKKLADPTLKLCKSQMKSFVLVRAM